jgi:hypothetical protein
VDNKTKVLNEYNTFETKLKNMVDSGEITQEMAEYIKKYKELRKDLGKNSVLIQRILDASENGSIL